MKRTPGSALLIMLWAIALIGATVISLARYIEIGLDEEIERSRTDRARELAESGLTIARHPLIKRIDPALRQRINELEGFEVRIISEGGRIPVNRFLNDTDRIVIETLFYNWGMDIFDAQSLVDKLVDWVDEDELKNIQGAERPEYEEIGLPQFPRDRPFDSVEEMALVADMDQLDFLRPDWREFFSVWSGGKVDVNFASSEVLQAVLDVTPEQAQFLVDARLGEDGEQDTEDDLILADVEEARVLLGMSPFEFERVSGRLTASDAVSRIEATGIAGSTRHTLTVIAREAEGGARQIVAYLDE